MFSDIVRIREERFAVSSYVVLIILILFNLKYSFSRNDDARRYAFEILPDFRPHIDSNIFIVVSAYKTLSLKSLYSAQQPDKLKLTEKTDLSTDNELD